MIKKSALWEDVGLFLRRLFRSQWPHLYVSSTAYEQLRSEVIGLRGDKVNLQMQLRSEATIGMTHQARFLRGMSAMETTLSEQAQVLAAEMTGPLRAQIKELVAERDLFLKQSTHHGLTELYNKAGLKQAFRSEVRRLVREWRKRNEPNRPKVFLIVFDLDHFKQANDLLGHAHGDAILQIIAELMHTHLGRRPGDLLSHPHGDEFVVVLPNATSAYVQEQAQAFLTAIRTDARLDLRHNGLRITASIGVAVGRIDHLRPVADQEVDILLQELLGRADTVMYEAKRSGRNSIALSDDITRWSRLE